MALTNTEINLRLTELRNLRKLYGAQKIRLGVLKAENKQLKERVVFLETAYTDQQNINVQLRLQMEELRTMVFGRKRKEEKNDLDDTPPTPKVLHLADSYKRPFPKENEVTETKEYPLAACTHCHGQLTKRETMTSFTEDIPLPQKKTVIKHSIEKGYCTECKRWSTSVPLPTAPVILGEYVKRYVTYLFVVCRLSYTQIQDLLLHTYDFRVSQGEIAKILKREGHAQRPSYERLKASIRGEPSVHLDETSWNLFIGDGYHRYAWTMVGGERVLTLYLSLGRPEAKGMSTICLVTLKRWLSPMTMERTET